MLAEWFNTFQSLVIQARSGHRWVTILNTRKKLRGLCLVVDRNRLMIVMNQFLSDILVLLPS